MKQSDFLRRATSDLIYNNETNATDATDATDATNATNATNDETSTTSDDYYLMNETEALDIHSSQYTTVFKVGLDVDAMNALIPTFASDVYPLLIDYLEGSDALDGFNTTESIIGGTANAFAAGFFLDAVDEEQISITPLPTLSSSDSIRLRVSSGPMRAGFSEVGLAFDITVIIDILCEVLGTISIDVSSIGIDIDITPDLYEPSNFTVKVQNIHIDGATLSIDTDLGGEICSNFNAFAETLLNLLTNALETLFQFAIRTEILDFDFTVNMPETYFRVPQIKPIQIFNNELHFRHDISRLSTDKNAIFVDSSLALQASLTTPHWRAGRRFIQPFQSGGMISQPAILNLVNVNIGADGVNNAIRMLWYLIWADLVTDPNAETSPLCKLTEEDPCPYPPLSKEFYPSDIEYWSLLPLGNSEKFVMNYVIEPPTLEFVDGYVHGTSKGYLHIEGMSFFGQSLDDLARISASVDFISTNLEYDASSETYGGLQLVEFSLNDLQIESAMRPLMCRLTVGLVLNVVRSILNELIDIELMDKANKAIGKVLMSIPRIPDVKHFPVAGKSMIVELSEASMSSISRTSSTQSSASLHAGVSARFLEVSNSTSSKMKLKERKNALKNKDSKMKEKLEDLVSEWANKSDKNSGRQISWHYTNIISNIKESHAFRFDESSKLVELSDVK